MIVEAPAKLNLSLRVLRRREDGFHDIESIMVRLPGLHDDLEIQAAENDGFSCDAPGVPTDGSNLVVKALNLFRRETGSTDSWNIRLTKRVPHGAGLGGGSSDAAFTLQALNELSGNPVENERLLEIAGALGSDVPFFLGEEVAKVSGRGEKLAVCEPVPAMPVVLLKPSFGVSTPGAYKAWKDSTEIPGIAYGSQAMSWGDLVNDLERPVFAKHRMLAEMKMWLLERPEVNAAIMSGSGSTMFAVLESPDDASTVVGGALREVDPTLWSWSGWTAGVR